MIDKEKKVTIQDESNTSPSVEKQETTNAQVEPQKSFNITTDQLLDLLTKLNQPKENLEKVIAGLAKAIEPDYAGKKMYDESEIDKDDYLTEPALFYTYVSYYANHGEKRYGHEVSTPYGRPIRFTQVSAHIVGSGQNKEVKQLSVAKVVTKKEADWLRKSPAFGIMFHENIKNTAAVDVFRASKLMEASAQVNSLDPFTIRQRAKGLGIQENPDLEVVKWKLVNLLADAAVHAEKSLRPQVLSTDMDFSRKEDRDKIVRQPIN